MFISEKSMISPNYYFIKKRDYKKSLFLYALAYYLFKTKLYGPFNKTTTTSG